MQHNDDNRRQSGKPVIARCTANNGRKPSELEQGEIEKGFNSRGSGEGSSDSQWQTMAIRSTFNLPHGSLTVIANEREATQLMVPKRT
jgi:hypothetical protein